MSTFNDGTFNDPEGSRLPIKLDSTSNGEFIPQPLERHSQEANRLAHERATDAAKRLGMSRRAFLTSSCGAAGTLLAFNEAHAAAGKTGGYYELPREARFEQAAADASVRGNEFIFDIQGHHFNPLGSWRDLKSPWLIGLKYLPHGKCSYPRAGHELGYVDCFTGQAFIKEVFLDSDTDIGVLTFPPSTEDDMPLSHQEASATRDIVAAMEGSHRLLLHGRVLPNAPGDLARMDELAEKWRVSAWKTYTQWSPDNQSGWWLDDDDGQKLIDSARRTGVRVICIHKGLPLPPPVMGTANRHFGSCRDVGAAAKRNPDITFIVYHSGFDTKKKEGAFVAGQAASGIDSLIQSLLDAGVAPNSNVYAELGSTWRYLMRDPDQAAHALGKLFKYVGENNVVWGTDSIWYGSPQDQIEAFRTFQISAELRDQHAYPQITTELRAKVFGLNAAVPYQVSAEEIRRHAAKDAIARARSNYEERRDPTYLTYGPRSRREFLRLASLRSF